MAKIILPSHQMYQPNQGEGLDPSPAPSLPGLRSRLNRIYFDHTKQPLEIIEQAMDRDNYMNAEEAVDFGLVDEVIDTRKRDQTF